jgi:hypothetical protein
MRASDEDRERAVAALERHAGAGRLTLDELADRVRVVCDARTLEELAAVVSDLPAETAPTTAERPRRELFLLLAISAITLVALFVFMTLSRHA